MMIRNRIFHALFFAAFFQWYINNENIDIKIRSATYPCLKFVANLSECHVLFDTVHTILEFNTRHIDIGYHRTNITCNQSKMMLFILSWSKDVVTFCIQAYEVKEDEWAQLSVKYEHIRHHRGGDVTLLIFTKMDNFSMHDMLFEWIILCFTGECSYLFPWHCCYI